jgi:hypothetical protein
MSYNGSGTFNINSTGQPVVAGTVISASTFNSLTADLATGLTTAITKDGQTTATAIVPFAQGISVAGTALATVTGTGSIVANTNPAITNPTITNYVETAYTANSSTAITLSLANGTVQIITLTGTCTITMPTAVAGKSFTLLLKQDATGSRTVTWTTVSWPSATAPTITSTASKMDRFTFISDGTSWFGATAGQNYT